MVLSQKYVSIWAIFVLICFKPLWVTADLVGIIETQGLSFVSPDYKNTDANLFSFIGAGLKSVRSESDVFKVNASGFYAVGNPVLSYLHVQEIYWTTQINTTAEFHFGRKLNTWSNVDQRWNLGFFQPQLRWNSLSPESQGLTGVFWDQKNQDYSLSFFASGIFIPDQGPGYELKDGKFQSNNPWFQTPPQEIILESQLLPIDYVVQTPKFTDVVFQPVIGLQLKYGEKTGWFLNLASQYKPSHQLALGYKAALVTDRVRVTLLPKTYMENLVALDLGFKDSWGAVDLSVLYEKPENPKFEETYNQPQLSQSTSVSPHLIYHIDEHFSIDLDGLFVFGGDVTERGPEADVNRPALTTKFLYTTAYEVGLNYKNIFNDQIKWNSQFKYRQAEKNKMRILKLSNKIDLRGPWKFLLDFILVETSDELTNLSSYRNLDQVWIGASYDF